MPAISDTPYLTGDRRGKVTINAQDRPDEFREALQRVLPDKLVALSLSIPPADMDYEGVIYQLNKRAQMEFLVTKL